jgi:MFS superfamily sulfate permease-like transporter
LFDGDLPAVRQNVIASFIVFLVALPLCLGIAVASGVSPEKGIVSGFIGGVVTGALSGSPLQVSGPANSLIVIVAEAVNDVGLGGLAVAVCLAGLMQIGVGFVGGGRLVRLFPASVTQGLMTGFAILIFASQTHVMLDSKPEASFLKNIERLPDALLAIGGKLMDGQISWGALFGFAALLVMIGMTAFNAKLPATLRKVPAALFVVLLFSLISILTHVDLKRVHVPDNLVDDFVMPDLQVWLASVNAVIFEIAVTIFILASSESLLSASAVDVLKPGHVSNYDRELVAQGVGNILCAFVGAIPIAGVIIRSTANIAAGATSRWSSVFHGVWLLGMVGLFPFIIDDIPMSILGAILIFSVIRLINLKAIADLSQTDRWAWPLYISSCSTVLLVNPMAGVGVGLGMHAVRRLLQKSALRGLRGKNVEVPQAPTADERA